MTVFSQRTYLMIFFYKNSNLLKFVPDSSWVSNSADVFYMQVYIIKSPLNTPIAYFIYTDIYTFEYYSICVHFDLYPNKILANERHYKWETL